MNKIAATSPKNRKVTTSLAAGFFLALLAMGLPMIGVSVNIYLGAFVLLIAFACLAYGLWIVEDVKKFSPVVRVNTLWALALLYFSLVGFQILAQYKKDHPAATSSASKPASAPRPEIAPATVPNSLPGGPTPTPRTRASQTSEPARRVSPPAHVDEPSPSPLPNIECSQGASCGISSGQTGGITAGTYIGPVEPTVGYRKTQLNDSVQIEIWVDRPYPNAKFAIMCDRPCKATEGHIDWGSNSPKLRMMPEVEYGTAGRPGEHPDIAALAVEHPETFGPDITLKCTVKSDDGLPLNVLTVGRLTVTPRR